MVLLGFHIRFWLWYKYFKAQNLWSIYWHRILFICRMFSHWCCLTFVFYSFLKSSKNSLLFVFLPAATSIELCQNSIHRKPTVETLLSDQIQHATKSFFQSITHTVRFLIKDYSLSLILYMMQLIDSKENRNDWTEISGGKLMNFNASIYNSIKFESYPSSIYFDVNKSFKSFYNGNRLDRVNDR